MYSIGALPSCGGRNGSEIDSAVIEKAMESRAIRTLEAMRLILEDDRYTDPECFEVIDTLVMQFFKELKISVDRHSKYD